MTTPDPFTARTRALVARFRRQRPLRAGSLLVTILGDSIAPRGGAIALASLIQLARPFGLTERLVRTSVGRLAHEQWVTSERRGRASFYSLTTSGRMRFAEATRRIYSAPADTWNGQWTLVILPPVPRKRRDALRQQLLWLGFGQLTPGVLAHPTREEGDIRAHLADFVANGELVVLRGNEASSDSNARLVTMGWDFGDLTRRYRRFIAMFSPIQAVLPRSKSAVPSQETSFVLRTLLLHEYRRIHLRDPLLPTSLLPGNWAGTDAYDLCRNLYARVFTASEAYLSHTAQTAEGTLPPPSDEIFGRFGGLPREAVGG